MKHLIHLIDGTWLFPLKKSDEPAFTNIHKINNMLGYFDRSNKNHQIVHYYRGLGSGNWATKYAAGALGIGIWDDIEEVYLNICSNYRSLDSSDPDQIYLIGYSRGAIVARVVAGLVDIGLLNSDYMDHFHHVRRIFEHDARVSNGKKPSEEQNEQYEKSKKIIAEVCDRRGVRVKFLGLFDSIIGGFGLSRVAQSLNVERSSPAPNVDCTVHLVAADERRALFSPSPFAHQSSSGKLEQIWVPGNHCNIGGGPGSGELSRICLLTMCDRIVAHTPLRIDFGKELGDIQARERVDFSISTRPSFPRILISPTYYLLRRRKIFGASSTPHEIKNVLEKYEILINGRRSTYRNKGLTQLAKLSEPAPTLIGGWPRGAPPKWFS